MRITILILLCMGSYCLKAQNDTAQKASNLSRLSLEELMNIKVVTASRFSEQKLTEAPSTMLVITARQIEERGYEQLEDALRDVPGVDLIHTYGQAPSFITIRGMYGDENRRVLFLIDGIVENSIMGGFEMAGPAYSLHNVERIEIILGPGSALYGANAYSGVINMITKKGEEAKGLQYQKGYGSFNTSIDNVMLGVKKSNIDLMLSGSVFNTDGARFVSRTPRYSNSYIKNAFSFNGNVVYTIKNIKTTLGFRTAQTPGGTGELIASPVNLLGLPSQGYGNTGKGGMLQSDFNGEKASFVETFSRTAFFKNEFAASSKLTFILRGQYRETGLSDKSYDYLHIPDSSVLRRAIFAFYANRMKGEVSANYAFNQRHSFAAGIQCSQDNLERGFRGVIPDARVDTIEGIPVTNINSAFKPREFTIQNNLGAYLQYMLQTNILKRTSFTVGGRYDNNNVYGTTINPRFGLVNQPHEKLTLKLLYGSAYRAPTNFELYTAGGTRIANPDLAPETIQTYEANIIYAPFKILLLQANLFQNELADIIIQDAPVAGGKTQNQNVGNAATRGIEAKIDLIPATSFSGFLNFTCQEGTQSNGITEFDMPNIATMKGSVGLSFHVLQLFSVSVIENHVGDRSVPVTNPLGKVPGYFSTNLVLGTGKVCPS